MAELSDGDRADRMQRLQSFMAMRTLARVLDAKDSPTEDHSERVAMIVRRLAEVSGWAPARIAQLADAARIHDIGKVCVPEEVLSKPGVLTLAEFDLVKGHPTLGAQMARDSLNEEQVMWIAQHHEQFGGAGYPNGLAGEQIAEGSNLLAIADSWDAMTTERSYSPSKPPDAALAECLSLAGSQFSPAACEALETVFA